VHREVDVLEVLYLPEDLNGQNVSALLELGLEEDIFQTVLLVVHAAVEFGNIASGFRILVENTLVRLFEMNACEIRFLLHLEQDHPQIRVLVVLQDLGEEVLVLLVHTDHDFVLVLLNLETHQNTAV
jgi:hypothetical protein